MKKSITLLVLIMVIFVACKKERINEEVPKPASNKIKVFKNTSGNTSANALQAQIVNTQYHFTINYYGTFDSNNDPDVVHSLTYKKDNSDTTVFITLDPATQKVQTIFTEVRGVRQPIVFKHEYIPGNDISVVWSIYNYNWANNTSTLKFQALMSPSSQIPTFYNRSFRDIIGGVVIGIAVVEAGIYAVATAAAFVAGVGAALAYAAPAIILAAAATGAIILASNLLIDNAGASDFNPNAWPPPANTPINNPVIGNIPLSNLPPSPCANTMIDFTASQDNQGNVSVIGVFGGNSPYKYAIGNLNFQSSQNFSNLPTSTTKLIFVMDANGCIRGKVFDFTVQQDIFFTPISIERVGSHPISCGSDYSTKYYLHLNYYDPSGLISSPNAEGLYVRPMSLGTPIAGCSYFYTTFSTVPNFPLIKTANELSIPIYRGPLLNNIGYANDSILVSYQYQSVIRSNTIAFKIESGVNFP